MWFSFASPFNYLRPQKNVSNYDDEIMNVNKERGGFFAFYAKTFRFPRFLSPEPFLIKYANSLFSSRASKVSIWK